MKRTELPDQGFVFWPVGAGDSTTVLVNREIMIQVDLNHLEAAKSDDDPRWPVVDELVECLPLVNGKRYLAAFVATHADQDHCQGFKELLEDHDVLIGELWFTPRLIADIDNEDPNELSADARALRDEALRRVKRNAHREAAAGSGDRLRVIGYHDSLQGDFKALPASVVSPAGTTVQVVDGHDLGRLLRIFVHSPFKDYMEDSERNRTSIGLHVTLKPGGLRALLLGDLDYEPVKQIFEYTQNRSDKEVGRVVGSAPLLQGRHVRTRERPGRAASETCSTSSIMRRPRLGGSCQARDPSRRPTRRATTRPTPRPRRDTKKSVTRSFAPVSTPTEAQPAAADLPVQRDRRPLPRRSTRRRYRSIDTGAGSPGRHQAVLQACRVRVSAEQRATAGPR